MDLKKDLRLGDLGFELEGSEVGVEGDGGLGNPSKRFSVALIGSVEVRTPKAESIGDDIGVTEPGFNSALEISLNSWVNSKPLALEAVSLMDCPSLSDSKCSTSSSIVGEVNCNFVLLSFLYVERDYQWGVE